MKKAEREARWAQRLVEMQTYERQLRGTGKMYIAGVDEVGRGPLAGPVVAACVVLPWDFSHLGVDDSKKLSETRREALYEIIVSEALAFGIGYADNLVIDRINILEATKLAMLDAIHGAQEGLRAAENSQGIDHVLIDALTLDALDLPQTGIVKGDSRSLSIAAASIVAKVTRDRLMCAYHQMYPAYAFDKNKGYGTKQHYDGIAESGICPLHRRTFLRSRLNG